MNFIADIGGKEYWRDFGLQKRFFIMHEGITEEKVIDRVYAVPLIVFSEGFMIGDEFGVFREDKTMVGSVFDIDFFNTEIFISDRIQNDYSVIELEKNNKVCFVHGKIYYSRIMEYRDIVIFEKKINLSMNYVERMKSLFINFKNILKNNFDVIVDEIDKINKLLEVEKNGNR